MPAASDKENGGHKQRYANHFDRKIDQRVMETVMRDHEPVTLSPAELSTEFH